MTESGEYDVQSLIFDEKELEGIPETEEFNLDTHIEGSGENTNVTMEYGDYVISFSPEIIEDEQNMEKATAGNVEVQEGIKTFSSEEEETEEEETEENLFQTEKESEIDIENISEDNEGNHAFEVVEYEYQDITEEETQTEAESEIVEKTFHLNLRRIAKCLMLLKLIRKEKVRVKQKISAKKRCKKALLRFRILLSVIESWKMA